tara:strand:+ start:150 stop:254 length:105 start_codon:yes stop_codon:yes gene_type:complete
MFWKKKNGKMKKRIEKWGKQGQYTIYNLIHSVLN